jgi:hypothetical protein
LRGDIFALQEKEEERQASPDENLAMVIECTDTRPKGNPPKANPLKDHFEKLLEASCTHQSTTRSTSSMLSKTVV